MPDEVVLKIEYTEQDFVDAAEGYRAPRRIPLLVYWLIISGLALMGSLYGWYSIILFFAVFVGLAFCLFVVQPLTTNILTRREFQASVKDELQLSFSDSGVVATSTRIAGKNYWSVFTGAIETDEGILLMYGENSYLIIPKRSLLNPSDEARFKQLLLTKVPNVEVHKRFGPSLGRVHRPVRALVISALVLLAACLLASLLVSAVLNQMPPQPVEE